MPELSRRTMLRGTMLLSACSLLPKAPISGAESLVGAPGRATQPDEGGHRSISSAAKGVFDYMIEHSTCQPPGVDFWRNPHDKGLTPDQNGWQGAQAIQSAIMNYEATGQHHYLKVVKDFSDWIEHSYSGRDNLTLCETWPGWDLVKHVPIGKPPSHFCIWCDDSGWIVNLYLQIYLFTGKDQFLTDAYETLINLDRRWGIDFQGNSRGLMYYDYQDRYSIYMSAQIIGALGLFDALRETQPQKARECLVIASKYLNFVENYLHSTGSGEHNITGAEFGVAKDLFEEEATFGFGDETPPPDAKSALKHELFTSPHMMMTAAYMMFQQAQAHGGDIGVVSPHFRDFKTRAIRAADAFIRIYPDGYVEHSGSGRDTVMMSIFDTNVNGFGCYWWTKHVVPLDPAAYGGVILRTAKEIIAHQGTGDISSPCWCPVNCTPAKSHSSFGSDPSWVTVRQASAASIIAAANWISRTYPEVA
jgi:hypothetical protein